MTDTTYNGYTDYETWATALWLDNDEGNHEHVRLLTDEARNATSHMNGLLSRGKARIIVLGASLEDFVQELLLTEDTPANLASDLLAHSLSRVNWREMAENYLAED